MKKKIAIALTAAMLTFPFSSGIALAETTVPVETAVVTTTTPADSTTTPADSTTAPADTKTAPADSTTAPTDTKTAPADSTTAPADTSTTTTSDNNSTEATNDQATDEDVIVVVDEEGNEVDPGTTPDSPFYWLTQLIDKLQVALTFDPIAKSELLEEQALEDLAAANEMMEEGKTEEAEKALTAYSSKVQKAMEFLDSVKDPESDAAKKLQAALEARNVNNIVVLGGLLEKVPPQAAQKIALNVVRKMEKAITKMDKEEQKKLSKHFKKMREIASTDEETTTQPDTEDQTSTDVVDATVDQETAQTQTDDQATSTSTIMSTGAKAQVKNNLEANKGQGMAKGLEKKEENKGSKDSKRMNENNKGNR